MSPIEARLLKLNISLPELPAPLANYVPAKRVGNLVFTAGQVSKLGPQEFKGKLGGEVNLEVGRAATRAAAINCLAAIKSVVGSLDHVKQVAAVHGLINSAPDCTDQAAAMNGASDLVVEVFGEAGKHVRTAAGVASLPLGFLASVYMIVEVE
jgi:enamine deaminase RidA (YjgF/YER057c/UK114 family)